MKFFRNESHFNQINTFSFQRSSGPSEQKLTSLKFAVYTDLLIEKSFAIL